MCKKLLYARKNNLKIPVSTQKHPPKEFYKKAILENFELFASKHKYWSLFFLKKRDSNTGVCIEYCEIFSNTYFEKHL